jgi:multidrug efflux pump subunit AcrB
MWIVQIALRRPYIFLVMALLILLATPLVLLKMPTDIFPEIDIPVISIVWGYSGLSAQEMGQRITAVNERSLTTTVNDIEHIESQSLYGITGLTSLDRAATQADSSVHSAQRAYDIASERYKGGVDTYLDVITAEQTLLVDQRQAVQIHGQQFLTAVYLIKALGGG